MRIPFCPALAGALVAVTILACAETPRPVAPPPPDAAPGGAASGAQVSPAAGPASYPKSYPGVSDEERKARAEAFRAQNPGVWDQVEVDEAGFVVQLLTRDPAVLKVSSDPAFTAAEMADWASFLGRNGARFGWAGEGPPPLDPHAGGSTVFFAQRLRGKVIGGIRVSKNPGPDPAHPFTVRVSGHYWPDAALPEHPSIDEAGVLDRLKGASYQVSIFVPGHTCDPQPGGPGGCAEPPRTVEQTLPADRGHTRVLSGALVLARGGRVELRWGIRVDLGIEPRTPIRPVGASPAMPLLLDAVTGEQVTAGKGACLVWETGSCL